MALFLTIVSPAISSIVPGPFSLHRKQEPGLLTTEFGSHKRRSLGSLPVHYLKWITRTLHVERLSIWTKLANEALSQLGTGNPNHGSDGHYQKGLDANGHCTQTLNEIMCHLSYGTNASTYASLLQRCIIEKSLLEGERVHEHLIRHGYADSRFLNNILIQMYGKCRSLQHARAVFGNMIYRNVYSWNIMLAACAQNGSLDDVRAVFAEMPQRDVVSWSAMIAAYAQNGCGNKALVLFGQMQAEGLEPNKITFMTVLDACASMAALKEGEEIHSVIVGNGWESDVVLGTAIVNMYGKCGSQDDARAVFAAIPEQNVISWNAMITVCAQNGNGEEALELFGQMQAKGFEPNMITLLCMLGVCASMAALDEGREIHVNVIANGWEFDIVVSNALVNMYGKCKSPDDARAVFAEMPMRNVILWSTMVAACVQSGRCKEAIQLFGEMQDGRIESDAITFIYVLDACASEAALEEGREVHNCVVATGCESDVVVGTALVNMYGKCGSLDDARAAFAAVPQQDVVSWSAMTTACAQNGCSKEALQLFAQMQSEGFKPNEITAICVLDACAIMAAVEEGQDIHAIVVGNGWDCDVIVGTALINMYGKCGNLDDARAVFVQMPQQNVVSWNAIIAACAQNGYAEEALQLFGQMQADCIKPDEITYICVLTACSHVGLVTDGKQYFTAMCQDHSISPLMDHFVCLIDLFGRAGQLEKAEQLINSMPFEPVVSMWLSLLSSCRIHGDVDRGIRVAKHVFDLDENSPSLYVLLADLYATAGRRWDDAENVRNSMMTRDSVESRHLCCSR